MTSLKDVLGIEFSNELTEEELVNAIATLQKPSTDDSAEVKKLKEMISKRNSEVADYKKKYEARLSEEEKAEAERKERQMEIEKELNDLRRERDINSQKAEFVSMGFDSDSALANAEALVNGDLATLNKNLKEHFQVVKQQAIANEIMNTPSPSVSSKGTKPITADEIMAIADMGERRAAMAEHPELFGIE